MQHWVFCILFVPAVTKAGLGLQGEEADSPSWWGSGRVLEGNVGLEILPWHFWKVQSSQIISKRLISWSGVLETKKCYLGVRKPSFWIPPLPITNSWNGHQCTYLWNGGHWCWPLVFILRAVKIKYVICVSVHRVPGADWMLHKSSAS